MENMKINFGTYFIKFFHLNIIVGKLFLVIYFRLTRISKADTISNIFNWEKSVKKLNEWNLEVSGVC